MMTKPEPQDVRSNAATIALARVLRAMSQPFRGSSPGATLTEYLIVSGFVALFAIVAFNRFGRTLHEAYRAEAKHVDGKGFPGARSLLGSIGGLDDPNGVCDLVTGVCVNGNGCFAAGTPVSTETGDRPIETIVPGDRVWARDPETGAVGLRTVTKLWTWRNASVITLELRQGMFGSERITVTPTHRFWVEGNGWVPAGALTAAPLWSTDTSVSASVLDSSFAVTTVYDLEVEGYHTYFVGHSRALVHNAGPGEFNCQNPAPPGFLPVDGTGGFPQAMIDKCKQEFRDANGPPRVGASRPTRPADFDTRLCVGKLTECASAPDPQECAKKWECIDAYIAEHPTSEYFTSVSVAQRVARQCSNPSETIKSCFKGPAKTVTVSPADQAKINKAAADRKAAQARGDQTAMKNASEAAGDAAMQAYANSQYPGYNCTYSAGSRVFDGVCIGPNNEVVILEAKGGGSQLGDRWDANGENRVQQGSPEYVEAVLADLEKGDAAKKALAAKIRQGQALDKVKYEVVNQKFDETTGNPLPPTTREFELDGC